MKISLMILKRIEDLIENLKNPPITIDTTQHFCKNTFTGGTKDSLRTNLKVIKARTGKEFPEVDKWLE